MHLSLQQDEGIEWIQFQSPRVHAKRVNVVKDVPPLPDGTCILASFLLSYRLLYLLVLLDPEYPNQVHTPFVRYETPSDLSFLFAKQWHLKNRRGGIDLNVEGAWNNRMTGEGVGMYGMSCHASYAPARNFNCRRRVGMAP